MVPKGAGGAVSGEAEGTGPSSPESLGSSLRRAVTRSCPVRQLSSAGEALSSGELVRTTMFSFACLYMFMAHRAFPKFRPATSLATGVTVNRSCSKSSLNLHPSS